MKTHRGDRERDRDRDRRSGGGGRRRDISPPARTASRRGNRNSDERFHGGHLSRRSPIASPRRFLQASPLVNRSSPPRIERRREYGSSSHSRGLDFSEQHPGSRVHDLSQTRDTLAFSSNVVSGSGDYDGYRHKFLIPDSSSLDRHADASRAGRNNEFHNAVHSLVPPSSSEAGLHGNDMPVPKSMFLDDDLVRTFYSLPKVPDNYASGSSVPMPIAISGSGGDDSRGLSIGAHREGELPYHNYVRGRYFDGEERNLYPRDAPYAGMQPLQTRVFSGDPTSSLRKDEFLSFYQDSVDISPKDYRKRRCLGQYADSSLGHGDYSEMHACDPMERQPLSPQVIGGSHACDYPDIPRRWRSDHGIPSSDDLQKHIKRESQEDYREKFHTSFKDPYMGKDDEHEVSPRVMRKSDMWDHHSSLERGPSSVYHGREMIHDGYDHGNGYFGFGSRPPPPYHESTHTRLSYDYGKDDSLGGYRGRSRSPLLCERPESMYRRNESPHYGRMDMDVEDINGDFSDAPSDMDLPKRMYAIDEEMDGHDQRIIRPPGRTSNRRIIRSVADDEVYINQESLGFSSSKRLAFGRLQHKPQSHKPSGSNAWFSTHGSVSSSKGSIHISNLKKRLNLDQSNFHGSMPFGRRQNFYKPHKLLKKSLDDRKNAKSTHDVVKRDTLHVKSDPPEGSEEFKQHFHKAFLRFSKLLNENPHHQKRYREQGKAGNLLCCVCGSLSKEFTDTHSLVMHAYNSLKTGLRTDHLGLHKALCVLMGWDWNTAPDCARAYHSRSNPEIRALKEDLILWPPIIIIHNSSIGNKSITCEPKIITNEGMEEILRGMGFGSVKARQVCRGKPANQSVMLVKFLPTFSGLQEAEELHKYYEDGRRGRKEYQEICCSPEGCESGNKSETEVDKLLYGYIATAEDIGKLDLGAKKRCMVKSRDDIKALADATLSAD